MPDHDALIIGAGMGGLASAYALTRRGLRVLLLEMGPAYDPASDYRLDRPDWEVRQFPFKPGSEGQYRYGARQRLDDDRFGRLRSGNHLLGRLNPDNARAYQAYHHVHGVGGSTLRFTAEAHRLHPEAMRLRSRFGVGADWPIVYADLEPWYAQAEALLGVAGDGTGSGARQRSTPYPLPAHPLSYADRRLAAGAQQLGLQLVPNPLAILSQPRSGRPACNYCGCCNLGCQRRDKGSADQTFLPAALATGRLTLRTGVQVLRLLPGADDRIAGVEVADSGGLHRLTAPLVVLAAGAVESPRLLLNSGLGNESGQVGRNFLETLFFSAYGVAPEPVGSRRGVAGGAVCWDFNAPDAVPGVAGGCRFASTAAEGGFLGARQYATRVVPGWGRAHKQAMRSSSADVLGISGVGEFLPNADSIVALDTTARDAHGMPLARIQSHLGEQERARLMFMADKAESILLAAGVTQIFERASSYDTFNATHVFGTCRMGDDPQDSVVNAQLRHHRWKNLHIADASVFPSSGGGEAPSLTIAALALRMGEGIGRG